MPKINLPGRKFKNPETGSEFTIPEIEDMCNACLEVKLTEWEKKFIDDISLFVDEKQWITAEQLKVLERIYAEKTK